MKISQVPSWRCEDPSHAAAAENLSYCFAIAVPRCTVVSSKHISQPPSAVGTVTSV
jgi:hypothetical protein